MPSNNPVFGRGFANAASGRPSAGWGAAPQQYDPYAAPSPYAQSPYAPSTTRYMTMDDVVTKTGLTFIVTVLAAELEQVGARTSGVDVAAAGAATDCDRAGSAESAYRCRAARYQKI